MRHKKSDIACFESSIPSSMLMSVICAPFSTWSRATSRAVSYWSFLINFLKRADPVTFVRSPTFTKRESGVIVSASRPLRRQAVCIFGILRGEMFFSDVTIAEIYSGRVPQQPPTKLTNPS